MAVVLPVLNPVPVTTTVLPPVICEEREAGQWGGAGCELRVRSPCLLGYFTGPRAGEMEVTDTSCAEGRSDMEATL